MIKRKIAAAIAAAALLLSLASCGVKKVDFSYFDENFSPFFARNFQDLSVAALTGETILKKVLDDDGVAQPVWDAYSQGIGIADVTLDYSGEQTVATVKFGDDARFSDGSPITAKDAAFSIYVYAQADYDGWCTLKSSELDGLTNYRYASAAAESIAVTEADINAELAEPSDNTKKLI